MAERQSDRPQVVEGEEEGSPLVWTHKHEEKRKQLIELFPFCPKNKLQLNHHTIFIIILTFPNAGGL